jgi:hypothetical protein
MLNSKPNKSTKYHQGLFVPVNEKKVIKLNAEGGLYYRSGLERKVMNYLDNHPKIIHWAAELIQVPYMKNVWNEDMKMMTKTSHIYFPDFYYEMDMGNSVVKKVVIEVKPHSETIPPVTPKNPTRKQLENFKYSVNMYSQNMDKWKYCIEFCKRRGFEFIILTEKHLG